MGGIRRKIVRAKSRNKQNTGGEVVVSDGVVLYAQAAIRCS